MARITVYCPYCGQPIDVPANSNYGTRCPRCKSSLYCNKDGQLTRSCRESQKAKDMRRRGEI